MSGVPRDGVHFVAMCAREQGRRPHLHLQLGSLLRGRKAEKVGVLVPHRHGNIRSESPWTTTAYVNASDGKLLRVEVARVVVAEAVSFPAVVAVGNRRVSL